MYELNIEESMSWSRKFHVSLGAELQLGNGSLLKPKQV